jgi:hypothetical protein
VLTEAPLRHILVDEGCHRGFKVKIRNEEDAKAEYLAYLRGEVPENCYLAARRAVELGFVLA